MLKCVLFLIIIFFSCSNSEKQNVSVSTINPNQKDSTQSKNYEGDCQTAMEYYTRGYSKSEILDYQGAIADYTKAIEICPNFQQAYYRRGNAKSDLQDDRGATADYTKAIEINSYYAEAYYSRGRSKLILGQKGSGCLDFSKAAELGLDMGYEAIKEYCNDETESSSSSETQGDFTTVKIGDQTWCTQNLNVSTYRNGDAIPQVQDDTEWINLKTGAWCYYETQIGIGFNHGYEIWAEEKVTVYGKLYNWYAVSDPRGLAPNGYHVPSDDEWTTLIDYLGGPKDASKKMKSTSGWYNEGEFNGTNESGFSGLPGGFRNVNPDFEDMSISGNWWSSTEEALKYDDQTETNVWRCSLYFYTNDIVYRLSSSKDEGFSVRCIKD